MNTFRAAVVDKSGEEVGIRLERLQQDSLMSGDVTVRVHYSSVNYKDSLVARTDGRVARQYPLIPGIDLAGTVLESTDPRYAPGAPVLAHGYDLGVAHHGGHAELARLPADWLVPLPAGLSARQAMAIGTAGFTAALSVLRLEHMGLRPGSGVVLVTGASGGLGSTAVALLAARGYEVAASTGSSDAHDYLRGLGATQIVDRSETSVASDRPLERARWAGAIDAVGGTTLAYISRTLDYGASVAACGNTGGAEVSTTVFPFILRAANVLGIDSVQLPLDERTALWQRLAEDLRPPRLDDSIARDVTLDQVPEVLLAIHRGEIRGRTVVRMAD